MTGHHKSCYEEFMFFAASVNQGFHLFPNTAGNVVCKTKMSVSGKKVVGIQLHGKKMGSSNFRPHK